MKKYIQPQTAQIAINIESHLLLASGEEQDTNLKLTDNVIDSEEYSIGKGWASDNWTEE
ncbi:MAG: hypothetical protein MR605_08225 [Bacteroidales bacterium]|nr:hypothetical protein [Bacteroidales bacterium]